MLLKELPREKVGTLVQATSQGEEFERSPGVHVSQLVRLVMQSIDPETYTKEFDGTDSQNWQQTGLLWEEVLTSIYGRRRLHAGVQLYTYLARTGEVKLDNVVGSPDGFAQDPDGLALVESKLTWKSRRKFDLDSPKFIAWKFQILAYLHMLGLTRCYLPVLFVNGTYDRYVPEFLEYRLDVSPRECEENWTMLLNTGRRHGLL